MKTAKEGFDPIVGETAHVLILGTFPGEESLTKGHYYAHSRNLFWDMMDAVCGAGRKHDYEIRCDLVKREGIAIWDVLKSCSREGSSDGGIRKDSFIINDISTFIFDHAIKVIFFNGKKAAALFKQYVEPAIAAPLPQLVILPSTSPANARLSPNHKLMWWLKIREYL